MYKEKCFILNENRLTTYIHALITLYLHNLEQFGMSIGRLRSSAKLHNSAHCNIHTVCQRCCLELEVHYSRNTLQNRCTTHISAVFILLTYSECICVKTGSRLHFPLCFSCISTVGALHATSSSRVDRSQCTVPASNCAP